MIFIDDLIQGFSLLLPAFRSELPWKITHNLKDILMGVLNELGEEYNLNNNVAIHKTAIVEPGVVIKGPAIIGMNCYICANAYLREGIFLDKSVKIGPGCEIKSSIICSESAIAHFNYIGNSIIGNKVNFEAGSIAANHFNERPVKEISVLYKSEILKTGVEKFGCLAGDNSRIGANAVLSPGTILGKNSIVKRLELVEQVK